MKYFNGVVLTANKTLSYMISFERAVIFAFKNSIWKMSMYITLKLVFFFKTIGYNNFFFLPMQKLRTTILFV